MTLFRFPMCLLLLAMGTLAAMAACQSASPGALQEPPAGARPTGRQLVAHASAVILPPGEPPVVDRVVISPQEVTLSPRERRIFTAVALDSAGHPVPNVRLLWRARDPAAGTISGQGVFTAGANTGLFADAVEVRLTSGPGNLTATATVAVTAGSDAVVLDRVTPYPPALRVRPGQVVGLGALGWDQRGRLVRNLKFVWSMRELKAGAVDQLGFFTAGQTPGGYPDAIEVRTTQVGPAGTLERRASVAVTVSELARAGVLDRIAVLPSGVTLAPGQRVQFNARGFDEGGQRLGGLTFAWSASPQAGSMEAPGSFKAGQQLGEYPEGVKLTVTQRTAQGVVTLEAVVPVVVEAPRAALPLSQAQIVPGAVTLSPGQRFIFAGHGIDAFGAGVKGQAQWRVAAPQAGAIDRRGTFLAGKTPGVYTGAIVLDFVQDGPDGTQIKATAAATVSITGPLARVELVPDAVTVEAGQPLRLTAIGYDGNGLQLPLLRLRWRVDNPSAGSINNVGVFTAGKQPGTYPNAITVTVEELGVQ